MTEAQEKFGRLMEIVDELRQKCPWDMKQTKESIRHLSIEEVYELSDTILQNDYPEMRNELGDLLMHTIFYASMARDEGEFDMAAVLQEQIEKLIRRHPHVYGDMVGATEEEINANWEKIKALERKMKGEERKSALDGVPQSLPSLIKAHRMQEKAANLGFDWEHEDQVWAKVQEEVGEFLAAETPEHQEEEMGDLLFALVNYCRFKKINPEDALAKASEKFRYRFGYIEDKALETHRKLEDMTLEQMEAYWQEAKRAKKAEQN
ncbi:MAG: nucleoside triphosphate pyrophosphohydrolase [Bacteroidota bacterium]